MSAPIKSLLVCFLFITYLCVPLFGQVTFVIESLPRATPVSDTLFITGSFNNWVANDPEYQLKQQPNGKFAIELPISSALIEYKFTRGSWMKTETDAHNQHRPNRLFNGNAGDVVPISIDNWQDLGGAEQLPLVVFYYFSLAFQAILLIVLAVRVPKREKRRFQLFTMVNTVLALFFCGAMWYSISNLAIHAYLILAGQMVYFLWGPLVLYFLLGFNGKALSLKHTWLVAPAIMVGIVSVMKMLNGPYTIGNEGIQVIGFGFNLIIFIWCARRFGFMVTSFFRVDSPERFLDVFLKLQVFIVLMVLINFAGLYAGSLSPFLMDFHLVLTSVSVVVFAEMYYLWRYPAILREQSKHVMGKEEAGFIKQRLIELMEEDKPFKDPDLTIARLSELIETKPHILSRVLNDHFHQNFRDFVNQFRVQEFILLAHEEGKLHALTFLGLAHEVGFNSKSTFNLAFKKVTGKNPRDYFKEETLETIPR